MGSHGLGLTGLAWLVGIAAIGTAPIWFAAKVVGAEQATVVRSALAMLLTVVGTFVSLVIVGSAAFVLVPIICVVIFKYVLDTSFLGAFILMIIAWTASWAIGKLFQVSIPLLI